MIDQGKLLEGWKAGRGGFWNEVMEMKSDRIAHGNRD
jgi:hypothetical protein